jgi:hypothetical protein
MLLRVWCEWDYGQDSAVFSSEEKATAWINAKLQQMVDENPEENPDVECFWEDGLVGFQIVELDPSL